LAVKIALTYSGKRNPQRVPFQISPSVGEVANIQQIGPTEYQAVWTIPTLLEGRTVATLAVEVQALHPLRAETKIGLLVGAVARIDVARDDDDLPADGMSHTTITASAFDKFDNPVKTAKVTARAAGQLDSFQTVKPGVFAATYTSPRAAEDFTDTIIVRDEQSGTQATLKIDLFGERHFLAHARVGYLTNFGKVGGPLVAGGVAMRLPVAGNRLLVGAEIGYYTSSANERDAANTENVAISVSAIPVIARGTFEFPLGRWKPYATVGAGATFTSVAVSSPSAGETIERGPRPTVLARLGLALLRLGPGHAAVEVGFALVPLGTDIVEGNAGGLDATAGYQYEF
jgi:hypothetical protein